MTSVFCFSMLFEVNLLIFFLDLLPEIVFNCQVMYFFSQEKKHEKDLGKATILLPKYISLIRFRLDGTHIGQVISHRFTAIGTKSSTKIK